MCGIAGAVWNSADVGISTADVERMISVLAHRGPDDRGVYHSIDRSSNDRDSGSVLPAAALGHRRLSIIDLEGGHQPLANEDETVWIVFNGEIYNYRELRPQLESQGHRFRTSCDTETIVHLYEEYGIECVSHLRGMFAFAIWDARRRRLLLARDRLGQKPLFYRLDRDRLLFASELKALLQIPGVPRDLHLPAVDQFLTYQYVPHPHCILQGFQKLPPAHAVVFEAGRLTLRRYWRPPYEPTADNQSVVNEQKSWPIDRWQTELRETLTEAVRLRLRSDVPLGAFLSGGVDSTIITGLMQQLSGQPVHTFSIGFPVSKFDERQYAREAADHLGTEHHEAIVEPSALEVLPQLIWQYDEPFADSSAIPTMYLSKMTRQHVKVVLSGDGGDELFAGYDRYRAVRLASRFDRLPLPVRRILTAKLWQRLPVSVEQKTWRRRALRFLQELNESPQRRYFGWISIFNAHQRDALYSDRVRDELLRDDAADFLLEAYTECPTRDFVTRTSCADLLTYLPCDILAKVDIASMTYGLECRSPLLDHRVAELAARMPLAIKCRRGRAKQILIDTFSDLLPASIQRRRKMGFGVPIDHWFRDELKPMLYDVLLSQAALNRGLFRPAAVRGLIDDHVTGRRDHAYRLWALLCLELWQRTYLDPGEAVMMPARW